MKSTFGNGVAVVVAIGLLIATSGYAVEIDGWTTELVASREMSGTELFESATKNLAIELGNQTTSETLEGASIAPTSESPYGYFSEVLVVPAGLPVPEPSALSILAVAAAGCLMKRRAVR